MRGKLLIEGMRLPKKLLFRVDFDILDRSRHLADGLLGTPALYEIGDYRRRKHDESHYHTDIRRGFSPP